jgi:hypothetical protein
MKTLKLALVAALVASTLTGCSALPAGCDTGGADISSALESQQSWKDWSSNSMLNKPDSWMGFSFTKEEVLQFPNCFDRDFVAGYENSTKRDANWDNDPNYSAVAEFLPKGTITDSVTGTEVAISADPKILRSAFSAVATDIKEGNGSDYDYRFSAGGIGAMEYFGQDSNRERDKATFSLGLTFSAYVNTDLSLSIFMTRRFDNNSIDDSDGFSPGREALCNGMLIEAGGEAYKLQSETSCGRLELSGGKYYFDMTTDLVDDFEGLDHMLKVMASGSFSIYMVDDSGRNHEFIFDKSQAAKLKQILTAFAAAQQGLGY